MIVRDNTVRRLLLIEIRVVAILTWNYSIVEMGFMGMTEVERATDR